MPNISNNVTRPASNKVTNPTMQVNENKDRMTGVNGRIWRHTIGRVSNLARIPLNIFGAFFQGAKAVGKGLLLPITYSVLGIYSLGSRINAKINKKENYFSAANYKGTMSIKGIGLDLIGLARLVKSTGICFVNVIVAPKKKSNDFLKGLDALHEVTYLDITHQLAETLSKQGRDASLSTIWRYAMNPQKNIDIYKREE